ncbi:MAG TPA: hypothetical protein VK424_00695 [Thermoplasmata archaeon]|nr:hypothetical protein [Thermoplasmata archaeon]
MTAVNAARSFVSIICLLIGVLFLIVAAVDFLENFGLIYCAILGVVGIIFLAISGQF